MKFNHKLVLVSISVVLLASLWLIAGSLPVAAAPVKSVITLRQETQKDRIGNEYLVLLARITQEDGYPLSERKINFFESVDLFGTSLVPIGSAVTSAVGVASLRYETRQGGEHKFMAVYSGDESSTSAFIEATFSFDNMPPVPSLSPPVGLEKITHWSMIAVGVVVLVVWGLLLGVFLGVMRGVSAGSKA